MDRKGDKSWQKSDISVKFPSTYNNRIRTVHSWLSGKRKEDNAEGLWRIHDSLYDLEDFIHRHPGGAFWLEATRGTDITEAFEIHHLTTAPENMLKKFKIRDATEPRNITLTLKEDGFYKVLKSRVCDKLQSINYQPSNRSDMIHTGLLIGAFLTAIGSVKFNSLLLSILASILICWTVIASHNYFHRRDNWRMYAFNLSLMNFRDWRISHALSHHIYTNSFHDLEITMFEPWFCYIPSPFIKNWINRFGSWFYGPIVYALLFPQALMLRVLTSLFRKNVLYLDDLIGFSLPLAIYFYSGVGISASLIAWFKLVIGSSFIFSLIGLNAAHHHPDIHHDGDAMRDDRDWGLFQLSTVIDRSDIKGSQFLVLTHFGDHALHHMFPTLDHGVLPQLYPILYETMEEFNGKLRECNQISHIIGQHKQLARIKVNRYPSELRKM